MFCTHTIQCRLVLATITRACVVALLLSPAAAFAKPPSVQFDASSVVECRDVTPETFAAVNPDEKVIEAKFQVSVLLTQGNEEDIEDLVIVITSPEHRLQVVDFMPKTQLATDVAGQIEIVDTTESTRTAEASVGGDVSVKYGITHGRASPSAGVGTSRLNAVKQTYKKLPPKVSVLASGTTNGQHGVFFKLRRSTQASLEGSKEFACLFVVPKKWRGDWAVLSCRARCRNKQLLTSQIKPCGRSRVFVGLYLQGDAEAKTAAQQLVAAQALYHDYLASNGETVQDRTDLEIENFQAESKAALAGSRGSFALPNLFQFCGKPFGSADDTSTSGSSRPAPIEPDRTLRDALEVLSRLAGR